jgi:hypothetical protein
MTLSPQELMRRFLLHMPPGGFHRIGHYGLLAYGSRKATRAAAGLRAVNVTAVRRTMRSLALLDELPAGAVLRHRLPAPPFQTRRLIANGCSRARNRQP